MFNVGDIVCVRPDLKEGEHYGFFFCNEEMEQLAGQTVNIIAKLRYEDVGIDYYKIRQCPWNFTNEMFLSFVNYDLPLDDSEFDLSEVLV